MRRTSRPVVGAILLTAMLSTAACSTPFPEAPAAVGAEYPTGGVPVSVTWPSDWLEGFSGESDAVGGTIVGLRLEHVEDGWVWRIRSVDPGRDFLGERVTEPGRGREALIGASDLELVMQRHVELSAAELADVNVSYYDAALLSGESYPSPRLIGLEREMENGSPVWKITTYDTDTGTRSVATVDALQDSGL